MTTLLRAKFLATMVGGEPDTLDDGAVLIRGDRVAEVGAFSELSRTHGSVSVRDLGDVVLMPGLVNAHTHLELSDQIAPTAPIDFHDWLGGMMARLALPADELAARSAAAAQRGMQESLDAGVVLVGDISRQPAATRRVLRGGPLHVVSFGEVQAMAQRRTLLEPRLAAAIDDSLASPTLRIGISPHAPYSIEPPAIARCVETARAQQMPLSIHLAETADEANFLADHAGPFREMWNRMQAWDNDVPRFAGGPIRLAKSLGLLQARAVLAHVNHCDDTELELLRLGDASVVYCPRTHGLFRQPPHRFVEMLACGINVCLGTDSRATAPDLNLLNEARHVYRTQPALSPRVLLEMCTIRGARALGMDGIFGSIQPGRLAKLAAIPILGEDSLREILDDAKTATSVPIHHSN